MVLIEAYCKECKLHYDLNIVVCHFCKKETVPIRKEQFRKKYKIKMFNEKSLKAYKD